MKSNILFTVTDKSIINDLKDLGINKFVFPLSFFCVGIKDTFDIEDIDEDNAYLYVNRALDTDLIIKLDNILHNLKSNIKGIIFEDLGVINLCNGLNIEKIFYSPHFNTNFKSINYMFNYVDEIIVSTDITEEEIDEIIKKCNKKISVMAFGLVSSMYSRRTLISNYAKKNNKEYSDKLDLHINDKKFMMVENEYGSVMYHLPYFDGTRLINKDIKYLFYFPIFLSNENILKVANNDFSTIDTDYGYLDTKTIYKIKE